MFKTLIPGIFGLAIVAMVFWLASNDYPAAAQNQNFSLASVSGTGGAGACMGMTQNSPSMPGPTAMQNMSGTGGAMNMSVPPVASTNLQGQTNVLPASAIEQKMSDLSAKLDALSRKLDQIAIGKTGGSAAAQEYTKGEVTKIDTAQKKLTIKHEELKSLSMPAMTMDFAVADEAMLGKVRVGQSVDFLADRVNGSITITEIK